VDLVDVLGTCFARLGAEVGVEDGVVLDWTGELGPLVEGRGVALGPGRAEQRAVDDDVAGDLADAVHLAQGQQHGPQLRQGELGVGTAAPPPAAPRPGPPGGRAPRAPAGRGPRGWR